MPANSLAASHPEFIAENILVSQRETNIVFIIDRTTGDVVWSIKDLSFGQHAATMIPSPFPGASHIILFDNGWNGGVIPQYRPYSRIPEIEPLSQQTVWEYNANLSQNPLATFSSPFRSNVQRLPNGNTLITEDEFGRLFEVTPSGEIVWEYVNPCHQGSDQNFTNSISRAYRVDVEWINGGSGPIMDNFVW